MTKRIAIGMAVLSLTTTAAAATAASTLTDRMQTSRMTVVRVDRASGQFLCAEHRKWTAVAPEGLAAVTPGDIVRVEARPTGRPHLSVVRTAADELASPER